MSDLLSTMEAATLYGCTRANLLYLSKTGRVPSQLLGKQHTFLRSDIEALMAQRDARDNTTQAIQPI